MAPVIAELQRQSWVEVRVLATAQHREMLDQVLELFNIAATDDLDVMQERQSLGELTGRLLYGLQEIFSAYRPDLVVAQGDTTTVLTAALAAFYERIPFAHVEAGLRTGDRYYPFPEEMNRVLVGRLAEMHFAPTVSARDNLLQEGISQEKVFVTGNTVIDALLETAQKEKGVELFATDPGRRLILVTAHRRENLGERMKGICRGISRIVEDNPDVEVLFPVHRNPHVRETVYEMLGGIGRVNLVEPLDYGGFVAAMNASYVILTDSGGVQEEAPALGKPVLVLRRETERPEAVAEGVVRLIGTDETEVYEETQRLLDDEDAYRRMAIGASPYGDGHATERIVEAIRGFLKDKE